MPTGKNNQDNSNRGGSGRGNEKSRAGTRNAGGRSGGDMSVREAGHMGGQRERELVQEGKQAERAGSDRNRNR